ncbi:ribosome biogenesis factor YjgA [Cognatazoarcus halotolerans]|uniref:ribosome biogenesis factor YjgA n=1 Tax=Cognatazoarcus halotolerans TaxID=2686016 RepID=UPI0013596246|nr:ribosome biogenesis factor YjgA [Cognatazoarcus halotolerans]MBX3678682.1 DUF615 domain-containing protein [Rhodocyclaceae bacterium]MCB1899499.1 DUF615 domain-containing protein [Rhodocyclaceae bacterium]MCP5309437.1 DUF615 domain-containing protein [Zoogloeaceae bacterium]
MDDQEFSEDQLPSKTRRKKEMHALQDLGEALIALSKEQLRRMPIPEDLLTAVLDAQRFTSHGARRRQMQYVGRLMRNVDPQPIHDALDVLAGNSRQETARQHRLERLREKLIDDEKVLHEIAETWPGADLQRLRVLRRNAIKEREQGKPPRAFRELFRELRMLESGGGRDESWDESFEEQEDE